MPDLDKSENPEYLILKLSHLMSTELDRRLRTCDVTISQYGMLKQLWRQEGRSQVELQELLGLEAATVTGLVQRIRRQGFIQVRTDPNDKRVQRIFLTEQGRALQQMTTALEEEVVARTFEGFSSDEREFFVRLLKRALRNILGK